VTELVHNILSVDVCMLNSMHESVLLQCGHLHLCKPFHRWASFGLRHT